jgi:flagellar basal-body rod protein FlgC
MAATEAAYVACLDRKEKALAVDTIASNIANINTTRTPEGGPYKRMMFNCKNHFCKIEKFSNAIIKYLPGHPDADPDGYVRFPDIVLQDELNAMKIAQWELKAASQNCEKTAE